MLPLRTSSISVHPTGSESAIINFDRTEQGRPVKLMFFVEATSVNGAAKSLLNFCDTLAGSRVPVSVSIATFHRGVLRANDSPNDFVQASRKRGIATYVIPERHRFDHQLFRSIRAIIRRESPDLVQTNNVKSHFLIKAAGVANRYPWIAFHHGYTTTDLKMKCYNRLDHWSLPSAKRVLTVCGAFANQLVASGVSRDKIRVIHNSGTLLPRLPAADLNALKLRLNIAQDATTLLSIGRLSKEKGHADLIAAAYRLRQSRPSLDFKLILVGFGPEQASLEALTELYGLQSRVVFACTEPDVTPFFNIADVFILPSHSEGSPHVVFEAMGAGVPIVATHVGGIPEILQNDRTAILAPSRRPDLLASSIARMLDSNTSAQKYANEAQRVLGAKHSPEIYARSLLGIYAELLPDRVDFLS